MPCNRVTWWQSLPWLCARWVNTVAGIRLSSPKAKISKAPSKTVSDQVPLFSTIDNINTKRIASRNRQPPGLGSQLLMPYFYFAGASRHILDDEFPLFI